MNYAAILAGGTGQRMSTKAKPKQFLELYNKPIIIYTLENFERNDNIDKIVISCVQGWEEYLQKLIIQFDIKKVAKIVTGGKDSHESRLKALEAIKEDGISEEDIVLVHDGVRPILSQKVISDNIESVKTYGNAITCVKFSETPVNISDTGDIECVLERNPMYIARSPQSFYVNEIHNALVAATDMSDEIKIDCCSPMIALGNKLHIVYCEADNIKITTPADYYIFKALTDLKESQNILGL